MLFSSLTFLFLYLLLVLMVYFAVPFRWKNVVLLTASMLFYGWGEPVYITIMILSTLIDYTHGMLVEKYRADPKYVDQYIKRFDPVLYNSIKDLQNGAVT